MKPALRFCILLATLPSIAAPADLVLDNIFEHARVIAYELPEADWRAEAIRYVEGIRDRFKKGTEVLDAASEGRPQE